MKKRKNWKKVAAALLIGSQIVGTLPWHGTTVFAGEIEEESSLNIPSAELGMYSEDELDAENAGDMENLQNQEGDTTTFSENLINTEIPMNQEESISTIEEKLVDMEIPPSQEEDISPLQATSFDLSAVSFQVSDIRDSSKVSTFNGADGKQAVIVFGNVKLCGNTVAVLHALTEIVSVVDMSQLNIYVFDIQGTSTEDILSQLGGISEQIIVNSIDNDTEYNNLFMKCRFATVGTSGFTMPMIIYKGKDGAVYEYTTGSISFETIAENVRKGGLEVGINEEMQILNVTGQAVYDEAYKVLDIVNEERAKEGLNALTMDKELLEAAMLRAAECSLYYSHTRPDGTECITASNKIFGENIALLHMSAEKVMNSWMKSEGHRANILKDSYHSIGIGCFYFNGAYAWTQCFGIGEGISGEEKTNQVATYAINAASHLVAPSLTESSGTLNEGETRQLQIGATQEWCFTYIDADSYDWQSDSPAATVDSNGLITAVSPGNAVITGRNKGNPSQVLTYTLTVTEAEPIPPAIVFGDSNGDGVVDSKDAVMIKRYMAGYTDQKIDLAASDVNVDGTVDSKDAVKILKKLAGYDVVLGEQ